MILKSHSKRGYQSRVFIYMLKFLEKRQQHTIKQHFDKLKYESKSTNCILREGVWQLTLNEIDLSYIFDFFSSQYLSFVPEKSISLF